MSCSAQRSWEDAPLESEPFSYASSTLKYLVENIERQDVGQLLDVGPINEENINFLSLKVPRLYVCDLFRRLDQDRKNNITSSQFEKELDYPPSTFDGILLWNLVDRLNESEVCNLVNRCFSMMKTGGLLMLFTLGAQVSPAGQDVFIIREGFRLCMCGPVYPHLPASERPNRVFLNLLAPFTPVKSLAYRNGIREFLFQRQ